MSVVATSPSHSDPPSDPDWIVAAVVAVVLHLVGFLVAGLLMMSYLVELSNQPERPTVSPQEEIIELSPEFFKRVTAPPQTAAPPQEEKRFARTSAEQESKEAPQETRYIGDRNTQAASEEAAVEGAVAVPSQEGEEAQRPEQVETIDDTFGQGVQDSPEVAPVTTPEKPEIPNPAPEESREASSESAPATSLLPPEDPLPPLPPAPENPAKSAEKMVEAKQVEQADTEFLETRDSLERPKKELPKVKTPQKEEISDQPKEATPSSQDKKKSGGTSSTEESQQSTPQNQPKSDQRTGSEVKKTLLKGSISRRGKSSLAVEKTALGRYQSTLGKAIEIEWQKNVVQYREHVIPGYLTVRFAVDANGTVSGLRFIESSQSGGIQNGFTLRAIQTAEIPKMPKKLAEELDGEGLELIYNFHF